MSLEITPRTRIIAINNCTECPNGKPTLRGNKSKGGLMYCEVENTKIAHLADVMQNNLIPDWCPQETGQHFFERLPYDYDGRIYTQEEVDSLTSSLAPD